MSGKLLKRIISVFLIVAIAIAVLPESVVKVSASSDEYTFDGVVYGKYSDLQYKEIEGFEGGKVAFDKEHGMIVSMYSSVTDARVPEYIDGVKVTMIADWVFQYRENLETLTLPEGLEKIGQGNFRALNIKEIDIPDSVTFLGKYSFNDNEVVEKIDLGKSLTSMGESSFSRMSALKSVTIPGSCKSIGDWCFQNNPELRTINIGEGLEKLGQGFGRFCDNLTAVNLPTTLKSIGNYSFRFDTNLEKVTVGKKNIDYVHQFGELGIKLGDYPFTNCFFIRKDYSPSYKKGKWYKALHEVKMTGDYPTDIVAIARSQLGYHEGDSFDEQHGNNKKGSKDFAEYNYFYGDPGTMWCGEFVDWCIMMAGVPDELYSLNNEDEEHEYTWSDTTYAGGSHKLQKGDVILFLHDTGDHVILVESVEKKGDVVTVYALDGNHSNGVVESTWKIDAKTGKTLDSFTKTNGYVATIYGPDWSLAKKVEYFNVTFNANKGKVTVSSKKVSDGAFYGVLPIPVRNGYTFKGWYTKKSGGKLVTAYRTVQLDGDITLYAHWKKKK